MTSSKPSLATVTDLFQEQVSLLEREREKLEKDKEQWNLVKKEEQKLHFEEGEIIGLNVGGQVFQTTVETLSYTNEQYPMHYFAGMMSGKFDLRKDRDGNIFIDRDGQHMGLILNFLRNQLDYAEMEQTILLLDAKSQREIRKELDYYSLGIVAHFDRHWTMAQRDPTLRAGGSTTANTAFIRAHGVGLCSVKVTSQFNGASTVGFQSTNRYETIGGNYSVNFFNKTIEFVIDLEKKQLRVEQDGIALYTWPTGTMESNDKVQVCVSCGSALMTICD